ncbi:MAG: hypothetical protein HFG20_06500 [Anaerotruncus sp.]|nr:hypothetical protein [Anaerotruncus sp.]
MADRRTEDVFENIYGGEDPAHQSTAWLDPTGFDNICGGTEEQIEQMLKILHEADAPQDK